MGSLTNQKGAPVALASHNLFGAFCAYSSIYFKWWMVILSGVYLIDWKMEKAVIDKT
jgi:hypothetical protein